MIPFAYSVNTPILTVLKDWDDSQTDLAHLGGAAPGSAKSGGDKLWEDNWDDDDIEDEFSVQLRFVCNAHPFCPISLHPIAEMNSQRRARETRTPTLCSNSRIFTSQPVPLCFSKTTAEIYCLYGKAMEKCESRVYYPR